jgi:alkanesulfonate monooxygenase SsuD/methylene tetrahydromethanopterin reductase-like flavin-dependent oxidoreductase (luciferase family)
MIEFSYCGDWAQHVPSGSGRHRGMELSFALPTSGSWATPENVTLLARAAESRGCRGLWTFQRVIYPSGSDLPAVYRSVLDPLVTLGFAASVTSRVRLGLAVINGPFYALQDGWMPASASAGIRTSSRQ